MNRMDLGSRRATRLILPALVVLALVALAAPALAAGDAGEASLRVPDLGRVTFGGVNGRALLMWGLVVCARPFTPPRSEEHTSELQSRPHLGCRLLLGKKKKCAVVRR